MRKRFCTQRVDKPWVPREVVTPPNLTEFKKN